MKTKSWQEKEKEKKKRVFYRLNNQKQIVYSFHTPISVRQIKVQPFLIVILKMQTIARTLLKNFHKKKSSTWEGTNHENENERVEEGWMAWPWWWWVEAKAESESKRVSVKWMVGLMWMWILWISAPKSFIAESWTWDMPQLEPSQLLRTQKVSWDGATSQQQNPQPWKPICLFAKTRK